MFNAQKDERLWRIELEAGMAAFLAYFFAVLGLMIARGFSDAGVLSDPDFLLVAPWLFTALVFFAVEWKKGYLGSVREENTRTPARLRSTRSSLLASVVLFAAIMFSIKRLNLFTDDVQTVAQDLMDACGTALLWGAAIWFFTARRSRQRPS